MTAPLTVAVPSRAAGRAIAIHAFWRHARFGLEAARRGDRIVAEPHRLALLEMWLHGPAWLKQRTDDAIAAMDEALPPEPPVELMQPAPPAGPHAPAIREAAIREAVDSMDGWLRLFCPWWR